MKRQWLECDSHSPFLLDRLQKAAFTHSMYLHHMVNVSLKPISLGYWYTRQTPMHWTLFHSILLQPLKLIVVMLTFLSSVNCHYHTHLCPPSLLLPFSCSGYNCISVLLISPLSPPMLASILSSLFCSHHHSTHFHPPWESSRRLVPAPSTWKATRSSTGGATPSIQPSTLSAARSCAQRCCEIYLQQPSLVHWGTSWWTICEFDTNQGLLGNLLLTLVSSTEFLKAVDMMFTNVTMQKQLSVLSHWGSFQLICYKLCYSMLIAVIILLHWYCCH